MLQKPAAHTTEGQTPEERELPSKPSSPLFPCLQCKDISLEDFYQGLLHLRLLQLLLCTPAAGCTLCRKPLCISRGRNQTIVFL